MKCEHVPSAVCLLCSDAVPWWRDARKALSLGEEPLNQPVRRWAVTELAALDSRRHENGSGGRIPVEPLPYRTLAEAERVRPFEVFKRRVSRRLVADAAWRR